MILEEKRREVIQHLYLEARRESRKRDVTATM